MATFGTVFASAGMEMVCVDEVKVTYSFKRIVTLASKLNADKQILSAHGVGVPRSLTLVSKVENRHHFFTVANLVNQNVALEDNDG